MGQEDAKRAMSVAVYNHHRPQQAHHCLKEYGDTGNDFELTLDIDSEQRLDDGAYVYVEGTEWGGVVV